MSGRSATGTIRLAITLVYSAGRKTLFLILAASIVTSTTVALQLLVGRSLLNLLTDGNEVDAAQLAPLIVALGALLLVGAMSQAAAGELRIPLGEQVYRNTMEEILDVATEVELEAFEESDFHNRLERALVSAGGQSSAVVFGLVTIVSTLVVAVGVVIVLFAVAPVLVPIAIVGYGPIAFVNVRNNRERYELERGLTELQRDRSYLELLMTDRIEAKEIRAYDMAPTLRNWHRALWDERLTQLLALTRRRLALTTVGSLVTTGVLVLTLAITLTLAARGSITIGDAAVAIVGLQQLSSRLQSAGAAFSGVHEGITFLADFETFRASLPVIRSNRPTGTPPSPPTVLNVDQLTYRYPEATADAVTSVGFELRRGQVMAIVGANGSGKTTLAKLICGLLPPTAGSISWDGIDLSTCDPSLVRAQIAPVFQDFTHYMFTIRHAIGLGDSSRLEDEAGIVRAAREAGVGPIIDAHPAGLHTRLGKVFADGIDISIGQWQRLAVAKALFRDAPIVVLDEPSASLDPQAEADLFDLLQTLCSDRIVIFISHRFSTVRSADVVMVLDHGQVVESGSHDELMSNAGLYHDMFRIQAERYGIND